ncbi:fasciclin domain-containing protein [Aquimarina sp. TRL1]|nr:fasciclin domain-containing protein [Aquimarina sp. TRL1]
MYKKSIRYSLFLLCFATISCKNEAVDKVSSPSKSQQQEAQQRQGQAFIKDDEAKPSVLHIAIGSKDHTTLVAAVQAAQLENSLVNAGPLTVFAPTNEAFNALPEGTVDNLLKPENIDQLAYILKHHVTPATYDKEFIKKFKKLGQASNENIPVEVKNGEVYVGGAKIIGSVPAGNGIVHVVDKVILPSK